MKNAELGPLIEPDALRARLGDPAFVVLDIRPGPDYEAGHIPGSVHSDYETAGWRVRADGGLGLLPNPEQLSELLGRAGVSRDAFVVIVSAGAGASDLASAARVYWTLKVATHPRIAILDGGYGAWSADASRPVETGAGRPRPETVYPVVIDETWRSDLDATMAALREGRATFVDARPAAHFEGREKASSVRVAGHIPGARSHDSTRSFDPDSKRFRPKEQLAQQFAPVTGKPVISYCNTGHSAALNWFVLSELLGRPDVRLFDGSMSQWTHDPERPVETGPVAE